METEKSWIDVYVWIDTDGNKTFCSREGDDYEVSSEEGLVDGILDVLAEKWPEEGWKYAKTMYFYDDFNTDDPSNLCRCAIRLCYESDVPIREER